MDMSRLLLCASLLGASLALPACNREQSPSKQQPPQQQSASLSAETFARGMQQLVGQQMGPLRIASVAAEGNVLVVTLDGATGWRAETSPTGINEAFLAGYCRNPNAAVYFGGGRTMRVDTMENGQNRIQGAPVDRCPAAQ
jgi:hypothetical protein